MVSSLSRTALAVTALSLAVQRVSGHAALYDKGMWGYNWTALHTGTEDNRPEAPLQDMDFNRWWWHGHMDMPPAQGDFMELPAGGTYTGEVVCDKGASSFWQSNPGGRTQSDTSNDVCPGQPTTVFHANNEEDVAGCALSIVYKSDEHDVKPEDLVVFSVNQKCPWKRFTDFQIPADMPACPPEGCICGWHWIHEGDSGSAQMYLNMYRCKINGATSTKTIGTGKVATMCGPSAHRGIAVGAGGCIEGPKTPFYWKQNQGNNVETRIPQEPPVYNGLYGYADGAQNDIFTGGAGSAPAANPSTSSSAAPASTTSEAARPVDPTTVEAGSSATTSAAAGSPATTVTEGSAPTTTPVYEGSPTTVAEGSPATTPATGSSVPTVDSPSPAGTTSAATTADAPVPTTTRRCKRKQRRSTLERAPKRHRSLQRSIRDTTFH